MVYIYQCTNNECSVDTVEVNKPMKDSSNAELCSGCKHTMRRVYTSPATKTADGNKY